jgi:predicted transcriptional regulator YheO
MEQTKSKSNEKIWTRYIQLVDFLAEVLGPNYEIVLHDISDPNHSIIAIRNEYVSGRTVGGPVTDLSLRILKDGELQRKPFITNYTGISKNGKRLRSSTYFIRDDEDRIVGLLCINFDTDILRKLADAVQCIVEISQLRDIEVGDLGYSETFAPTAEELTLNTIRNAVEQRKVTPGRMTKAEKMEIVRELNEKGIFLLKGAVAEVAKALEASEASIYRYLKENKTNSNDLNGPAEFPSHMNGGHVS